MNSKLTSRIFPAIAATALLAACEYSPNMTDRTIAYNQAVAQSTNNLFLLNALRAAARQPTYYSRNQSNSATASITPGLSSTFPDGNGITRTISPRARVTQAIAKAALMLTPSLSETESNQLTLSNLDDQPSMNGLLTPVTLQQMSNYLQEGFSPEQLDLLYIGSITVPRTILRRLPDAVAEACATKVENGAGFSAQQTYCRYFFGDGRAGLMPHPWTYEGKTKCKGDEAVSGKNGCLKFASSALRDRSLFDMACFDNGTIPSSAIEQVSSPKKSSSENVPPTFTFINDPAIDNPDATGVQHRKSFACFHQVLLALLALDFVPTDTPPKFLYRLALTDAKTNSRFFADLTQQKLQVSIDTASVAVCKPADDMTLSYSGDAYVAAIFNQPEQSVSGEETNNGGKAGFNNESVAKPKTNDCAKAAKTAETAEDPKPEQKPPQIKYTTRSLEAIVYYLGQIIRRYQEQADSSRAPVTFYNAADIDHPYWEDLFDVRKGSPPSDAIAVADGPDGAYYVPGFCLHEGSPPRGKRCIEEYPDHSSAQVLTMLNQLWGLNKTQATAPVIPTVTVINP